MENIRDGLCGKMCRVPCQAVKDRTLGQSLTKSAKSKTKPYLFLCLKRNGNPPERLWAMIFPLAGRKLALAACLCNRAYRILNAQERYLFPVYDLIHRKQGSVKALRGGDFA